MTFIHMAREAGAVAGLCHESNEPKGIFTAVDVRCHEWLTAMGLTIPYAGHSIHVYQAIRDAFGDAYWQALKKRDDAEWERRFQTRKAG